jgi:hypothetical protein
VVLLIASLFRMEELELKKSQKYSTMLYTFDEQQDDSSSSPLAVSFDMDETDDPVQTGYSAAAMLNSSHNCSGLDLVSSDPAKLYARDASLSSSLSSSLDCDTAISQRIDALTEDEARKWLLEHP